MQFSPQVKFGVYKGYQGNSIGAGLYFDTAEERQNLAKFIEKKAPGQYSVSTDYPDHICFTGSLANPRNSENWQNSIFSAVKQLLTDNGVNLEQGKSLTLPEGWKA